MKSEKAWCSQSIRQTVTPKCCPEVCGYLAASAWAVSGPPALSKGAAVMTAPPVTSLPSAVVPTSPQRDTLPRQVCISNVEGTVQEELVSVSFQLELTGSLHFDIKKHNLIRRLTQCFPNTGEFSPMLNLIILQLVWQTYTLQVCTVEVQKQNTESSDYCRNHTAIPPFTHKYYLLLLLLLSPFSATGRTDLVWILNSTKYIELDIVHWEQARGTLMNYIRVELGRH